MRIFYLILCFICLCDLLHAQTVRIAYEGDPLTDKERRKIEQTLQYEVEFYAQFGLPDTLNLQLTVFNKREDALVYLNKFNIHPPKSTNGIYISRLQKAIILSREKEYQQGLGVIYHELSHHLTLQITAGRPPIWFNEGLILSIVKSIRKDSSTRLPITKKEESALYICWGTLICSPLSTAAKRNL
mgnify:CR=1 FL=1